MISESLIRDSLKSILDPELGHNIVDLGLIYHIELVTYGVQLKAIKIVMTLTTPGCPLAPYFLTQVKETISSVSGLNQDQVDVDLVFDPPWTRDMMTDDLKLQLGI